MARAGAQVAELTPVEILRANGGRKARLSGHGQSPVAQLIPYHARERCARWTASACMRKARGTEMCGEPRAPRGFAILSLAVSHTIA